jgi:hypothetical protein
MVEDWLEDLEDECPLGLEGAFCTYKKVRIVMFLTQLTRKFLTSLVDNDNAEMSIDKIPTFEERNGKEVLISESFTVIVTYKVPIEV